MADAVELKDTMKLREAAWQAVERVGSTVIKPESAVDLTAYILLVQSKYELSIDELKQLFLSHQYDVFADAEYEALLKQLNQWLTTTYAAYYGHAPNQ